METIQELVSTPAKHSESPPVVDKSKVNKKALDKKISKQLTFSPVESDSGSVSSSSQS